MPRRARHRWLAHLVFLTAIAALAALAFTQHLGAELYARPTDMRTFTPPRFPPVDSRAHRVERQTAAILRRDLFDSAAPPYTPEARPDACGHDAALVEPTGPTHYRLDTAALRAHLDARADFCLVSNVGEVRIHRVQGLELGYELYRLRPGSLHRGLGFCARDVLLAVNGQRLTSPTRALELPNDLSRLAPGERLEVTVLRGREEVTLRYVAR